MHLGHAVALARMLLHPARRTCRSVIRAWQSSSQLPEAQNTAVHWKSLKATGQAVSKTAQAMTNRMTALFSSDMQRLAAHTEKARVEAMAGSPWSCVVNLRDQTRKVQCGHHGSNTLVSCLSMLGKKRATLVSHKVTCLRGSSRLVHNDTPRRND